MPSLYDLLPQQPARRMGELDPYDEAQAARDAAAASLARGQRPRSFTLPGRQETANPDPWAGVDFFMPHSPADVALYALGGPFGRVAKMGLLGLAGAMQPTEAEAGPASKLLSGARKFLTPEGGAIAGREFNKRMGEVKGEIAAMPKGAGPLDLSGELQMDVPQRAMPRYEPPRGVSERMQRAMENPQVIEGVKQSMQEGLKLGAEKWYLNNPIYQAWVNELGPTEGPREFARFMDYVAATSPKTEVPENIRNASYYYSMHGRDLPEKLPYPYGGVAQNLHVGNIEKLIAGERAGSVGAQYSPEWRGWDIYTNPKPASFSEDLQGNLIPTAMDTHAVRNVAMRTGDPEWLATSLREIQKGEPSEFAQTYGEIKPHTKPGHVVVTYRPQKLLEQGRIDMPLAQQTPTFWTVQPNPNEYGAMEDLYSRLSRGLGLMPAQGQSTAWAGAGPFTGLGTVSDQTFPEMFNNRVLYTAMMRNEHPQETLRKLIRKQAPLLSVGGAGTVTAPSLLDLYQPQQQ